jgi:23S rRNA G2069 N7-methylase RlmK/C1962 C5-methylase RlmI
LCTATPEGVRWEPRNKLVVATSDEQGKALKDLFERHTAVATAAAAALAEGGRGFVAECERGCTSSTMYNVINNNTAVRGLKLLRGRASNRPMS